MNSMANNLIRADYDIKSILGEKKYFKKFFVYRRIQQLKKDLYDMYIKPSFTSYDIVNLCQLVHVAKMLKLSDTDTNNISIISIKGNGVYKWPIVGIIIIDTESFKAEYRAHMDSEMDKDGEIDLHWVIHFDNETAMKAYGANTRDISLSYSTKEISKSNVLNLSSDIAELYDKSCSILPSIFTIFIENILEGLKERYLKDESKNSINKTR